MKILYAFVRTTPSNTLLIGISILLLTLIFLYSEQALAKQKSKGNNAEDTYKMLPIVSGSIPTKKTPWMVGLLANTSDDETPRSELLFCGGSLISSNWILTAAHCVVSLKPPDLQVVLGSNNLNDPEAEVVDIEEIVVHPFYSASLSGNDIALLKLEKAVGHTPVSLKNESSDLVLRELTAVVLGWGNTAGKSDEDCELEFEDPSVNQNDYLCLVKNFGSHLEAQNSLLEAQEKIISDAECIQLFDQLYDIPILEYSPLGDSDNSSQNLCTYDTLESGDPCFGDSGGPLVIIDNGVVEQVGITSSGLNLGCTNPNAINIYTKVSFYLDFIDDVLGREQSLGFESYCPEQATMNVEYQNIDEELVMVILSWDEVEGANNYILRYLDTSNVDVLGKLEFDAGTTEVSAPLATGFDILVSIQARSRDCDGPASELLSIRG